MCNSGVKTHPGTVERFVLITHCHGGGNFSSLSDDEQGVLASLLGLASFGTVTVTRGDVHRHGVVINKFCPFKVLTPGGRDHVFATGWLNDIVRLAHDTSQPSPEDALEAVRKEIEHSQPLKPIQLTDQGDVLTEIPPSPKDGNYLVPHTGDDTKLPALRDDEELRVGEHRFCGGTIYRLRATEVLDVLGCSKAICPLGVIIPRKISTYGELREWLPRA